MVVILNYSYIKQPGWDANQPNYKSKNINPFCFSLCCGEAQWCSHQMEIMSSAVQTERDVLKRSPSPDFHITQPQKQSTHESTVSQDCNIVLLLSETCFSAALKSLDDFLLPHLWKCIWQICISDLDVHWYSILHCWVRKRCLEDAEWVQ